MISSGRNHKMWKAVVALIFNIAILFIAANGFAQSAQKIDLLKTQFPETNAVLAVNKEALTIELKETGLAITSDNYYEMVYLTDHVNEYANKSIYYSDFSDVANIEAKTITSEKAGNKTLKVLNIFTKDDFGSGIFYGSGKKKEFVFPGVQEGARSVLSYKEIIKDPHFLGAFYFGSYVPVINGEYSVTFPKEVKIKYRLLGGDTSGIEFSSKPNKKSTTYTWKVKNFPAMNFEEDSPPLNSYSPHVVVYIDEYVFNGQTVKVLGEVKDLYNWYYSLTKGVNDKEDEGMKTIVDSLIKGVNNDSEKAKRIFYWVQDKIKYVAFEAGLEGFVPRNAALVCSRKYGDCKDMASIITNMMNYAGIKAHLTWIGTRDIPYTYEDVPLPITDNHMIACAEINGKKLFFDATGICTPYGFPTAMIQGKEALVGEGENKFEIIKVPVVPKEKNTLNDTCTFTVENKILKGKGKSVFTGYKKLDVFYKRYAKSKEEANDAVKAFIYKGSNKFNVTDFKYDGLDDRDKDLTIDYDFTLPDYAQVLSDQIYVNLNLDKSFGNEEVDIHNRKTDRVIEYKFINHHTSKLELPQGFNIKYLPPNDSFHDDEFGYDISYKKENNSIYCDKSIYINQLLLQKSKFETWNKMISQLNKAYKEVVVLQNSK